MIILHCFFPCQMLFESFRAKSPDFAFDHCGFHFTVSLECSLEVEVLFLNQFVDVNLLFEFEGDNSYTLEREPHTIKIFEVCKSQTISEDSVFCFCHGYCANVALSIFIPHFNLDFFTPCSIMSDSCWWFVGFVYGVVGERVVASGLFGGWVGYLVLFK